VQASERVFVDTNVLVYADDLDAGDKRAVAQTTLRDVIVGRTGVVSTQVLQEYFVVATRKLGVAPAPARRKVELLSSLDVVRVDVPAILGAIDLHRLHAISFWDALIVECAAAAGCGRILSEDLQHGWAVRGVRVENPFRGV
jgi:predicted nucleic acid-binding protein